MYPFFYTVVGIDLNEEKEKYYLESGIGFCENFGDAATRLEDSFGSELVCIKHLELASEDGLVRLTKPLIEPMKEIIAGDTDFAETEIPCNRKGEVLN